MIRLLDRLADWWIRRSFDRRMSEGEPVEINVGSRPVVNLWSSSGSLQYGGNVSTATTSTRFAPPWDDWNSPGDQQYDDL